MILYTFRCETCGYEEDIFTHMGSRNDVRIHLSSDGEFTCMCGLMTRVFTPPAIRGDSVSKS